MPYPDARFKKVMELEHERQTKQDFFFYFIIEL